MSSGNRAGTKQTKKSRKKRARLDDFDSNQLLVHVTEWNHRKSAGISTSNYHVDLSASPDLLPTLDVVSHSAPDDIKPFYLADDVEIQSEMRKEGTVNKDRLGKKKVGFVPLTTIKVDFSLRLEVGRIH